jgi:hypothetical protein
MRSVRQAIVRQPARPSPTIPSSCRDAGGVLTHRQPVSARLWAGAFALRCLRSRLPLWRASAHSSVCSAISSASSTSMPRYRTVLSSFVWEVPLCTELGVNIRRLETAAAMTAIAKRAQRSKTDPSRSYPRSDQRSAPPRQRPFSQGSSMGAFGRDCVKTRRLLKRRNFLH